MTYLNKLMATETRLRVAHIDLSRPWTSLGAACRGEPPCGTPCRCQSVTCKIGPGLVTSRVEQALHGSPRPRLHCPAAERAGTLPWVRLGCSAGPAVWPAARARMHATQGSGAPPTYAVVA